MITAETCAVENRIEKGKVPPGLTSLHCECLFFLAFHEHMYDAAKLLTSDSWRNLQWMIEKNGFEV